MLVHPFWTETIIRSKFNSRGDCLEFFENFGSRILIFLYTFFGGPGGFRKVREVNRKIFPLFSSKALRRVNFYDQKTEKVHKGLEPALVVVVSCQHSGLPPLKWGRP